MLYPLIGARLHGWLDDVVVVIYLLGAWLLGLHGAALVVALAGAGIHFLLTRFTAYPQGTFKVIPFRVHAFIELGEGLAVLAATAALTSGLPLPQRAFLFGMGASQLGAFAFSDYGRRRARAATPPQAAASP
jgi:hypothetical protein